MKSKVIILSILFYYPVLLIAQNDSCNLVQSSYSNLYTVVTEDIRCIAQNSDKDITLFYTFAGYCIPCQKQLPKAIQFSKEHNLDLYILLMDRENDLPSVNESLKAIKKAKEEELSIVIISDSLYSPERRYKKQKFQLIAITGKNAREKYRNFITEITPPQFENIDDMSKHIVLNKQGEVIFVSNYKDSEGDKSGSKKIEKLLTAIEKERNSRNDDGL
jgi:thiol-disulfide isomerase/thioredoxin